MKSNAKSKNLALNKTQTVTTRVLISTVNKFEKIGRPGTIASAIIKDFFKVKLHEETIPGGTVIISPDESVIFTAHNDDQIIVSIQKNNQSIILHMNEETACHLISKINQLVNLNKN